MVDNMEWFNVFGLIFIAVIMIPNVVFAIKCKDGFDNKWNNKYVEVTEQVGRLGCFGFMIINIPGTWFGWWSDETFAVYLIVDTILVMLYCAIWIICFKKNSIFRALALSIIPSMLFLFSGIMSRSVLLIIASVLFAPSHIVISYKLYENQYFKQLLDGIKPESLRYMKQIVWPVKKELYEYQHDFIEWFLHKDRVNELKLVTEE